MRHRVLVPVLTLTCGLAACDGVRDSDYEGEVLASLEGTVTTADASDVPEDISVPVIWDVMSQEPRLRYAEFPEVTGDFPARFRLDFHQPPEEEQLVEFPDGNAIALGRLFITTYDPDEPLVLDEQGGASVWSWG